nr:immunoglobulin light chain junction region [Macaca mulatta]
EYYCWLYYGGDDLF